MINKDMCYPFRANFVLKYFLHKILQTFIVPAKETSGVTFNSCVTCTWPLPTTTPPHPTTLLGSLRMYIFILAIQKVSRHMLVNLNNGNLFHSFIHRIRYWLFSFSHGRFTSLNLRRISSIQNCLALSSEVPVND